jgi:hypothetical protein
VALAELEWFPSIGGILYRVPLVAGPFPPAGYRTTVHAGEFPGGTAPDNTYKEWFSWAVVAATAAAAGLVVHIPSIDANKNDVRLETWGPWDGRTRTVGLQLKATSKPRFVGPPDSRSVAFPLDSDSYNELVGESTMPRFLVVVALPDIGQCWVRQRESLIGLSAAAWWVEVKGETTNNETSRTVHLPVAQRFDLIGLRKMLEQA